MQVLADTGKGLRTKQRLIVKQIYYIIYLLSINLSIGYSNAKG